MPYTGKSYTNRVEVAIGVEPIELVYSVRSVYSTDYLINTLS